MLPKKTELRLREVVKRVHEHRVGESLAKVEEAIAGWRAGKTSPFAVDEAIHQHQLRSRKMYMLYANAPVTSPEMESILREARDLKVITDKELGELLTIPKATRR